MPRQMPTTLRLRFRAQTRGGSLLHHVPNRPPRFPTSAPPPGPSAHPSGSSIRSQRDSFSFNPTAFKTPVRTPVATEFNSREQLYCLIFAPVAQGSEPTFFRRQLLSLPRHFCRDLPSECCPVGPVRPRHFCRIVKPRPPACAAPRGDDQPLPRPHA